MDINHLTLLTDLYELTMMQGYFKTGNDDDGNPYRYQSLDDYIGVSGVNWQDRPIHRLHGGRQQYVFRLHLDEG